MKKYLLLVTALALTAPALADGPHYISVRGEGEVKVKPDVATVTINVHARAKDAQAAQAGNARELARVMSVLKDDFKIEAKDIQTSGFRVGPEYDYQAPKRRFLGYVADHSLTFACRRLDKVGEILDKLVAGREGEDSVQVSGVVFDSEKRKDLELQALELAMKNASARAEALARFARKPVKGVLRISDSSVSYQPYRETMGGLAKMAAADAVTAPTRISGGEITVSAGVAVDYEID